MDAEPTGLAPIEPHLMRITSSGKIRPWVEFSLDFFEKNKQRPLVLHTLPVTKANPIVETIDDTISVRPTKKGGLSTATATIPRLISVTEIIKREYLKMQELNRSTQMSGLHQYNEIGCLEDLDSSDETQNENGAAAALAVALEGKNYLKIKKTPYMKITLCRGLLGDLVDKGATYQPPSKRKMSKSAKARVRKRQHMNGHADI